MQLEHLIRMKSPETHQGGVVINFRDCMRYRCCKWGMRRCFGEIFLKSTDGGQGAKERTYFVWHGLKD